VKRIVLEVTDLFHILVGALARNNVAHAVVYQAPRQDDISDERPRRAP
jgi:hypothetical protein